jgi:hypothetical protein
LIFDRRISSRTPGTWRTRVITKGVDPQISCYYRSSRIKQYFNEHRALRTETVVCNTRDFGIGRRVTAENWKALRAVGEAANQRLCDAQAADARPAPDVATFTQVTRPSQIDGQHAPALPFGDPRVMAVLAAVIGFTHLLAGFDNPHPGQGCHHPAGPPLHQPPSHLRPAPAQTQRAHRQAAGPSPLPTHPTGPPRRGAVHQGLRARPGTRLGRVRPKAPNRSRQPQRSGARLAPTRPTPQSIHQHSTHRSLNPKLGLIVNFALTKRS